ncbi:MAG: dehydrogenase subunit, partial [Candidatus Brocadiaceae bacterium]|nr:dehydrogenase subunit [Candidatus Brocadiaceae bacterium]
MTTTKEKSFQTEEVDLSELEIILENYKGKRGAIIPVLQKVQNKYGYLPEPAVY